jgi:hypothetical protein
VLWYKKTVKLKISCRFRSGIRGTAMHRSAVMI